MENVLIPTPRLEADMSVIIDAHSLSLLKEAKDQPNGKLVLTSFQLRQSQKDLIDALARNASESQATVIRTIIDEWRELKLKENEH